MSSYSEGQVHQLADALERAGFTPADVTALGQFPKLTDIRGVVRGELAVRSVEHVIDTDADPFCPEGWAVEEHRKGGKVKWDPKRIQLYLSPYQQGGVIKGNEEFRKELANKPVLNANVLDYLLAHPELIPQEWKTKLVFFWGTIYRGSGGYLYVRCLSWDGGRWRWVCGWLDGGFNDISPAACWSQTA